jgi:hypothetical protein
MSEAGERQRAKAKEDTCASGAKPRPEGRVREHRWPPTTRAFGFEMQVMEAARRRAIEAADNATIRSWRMRCGGRE